MKKFKKLIPAFCAMLVSAAMLGTSTYAWFSVNKKVEASGMSVTAMANTQYFVISTDSNSFAATDANKGQKKTLTSDQITQGGLNSTGSEKTSTVYPIAYDNDTVTLGKADKWWTANVTEYGSTAVDKITNVTSVEKTGSQSNVYENNSYFVGYTFYVGLADNSSDFTGYIQFAAVTPKTGNNGVKIAGVKVVGEKSDGTTNQTDWVQIEDYAGAKPALKGYTSVQYKLATAKTTQPTVAAKYLTVTVYVFIDGNADNVVDGSNDLEGVVGLEVNGRTETEYNVANA